ncbi:MAG: PEP/pyruvate-binding domain-containing protein [Saprospiraceae bacterium]
MVKSKTLLLLILITCANICVAQVVPILDYSINNAGQVQLEIDGDADKYYLLTTLHEPNLNYQSITSMTMGIDGPMIISEPLEAYPLQSYQVTAHSIANPDDTDGDGIDDITEFNNMPTDAPLNFAEAISIVDGATSINDAATFASLAVVEDVPWAPFLNGTQFVKFGILDRDTDEPKVYFINSSTHFIHANFFSAIGANVNGDDGSGEIVYNPNEILPNGVIGSYSFNFSFGDSKNFEATQRTFELLAANMPFLQNNLQHFIGNGGEANYQDLYQDDFVGSRINVVLESQLFADVDFLPFHQAEGYGFFRHMTLDENPGSRDVVLYDALPNSLPRVGGIITSVIQTPLSHVNLRAIQDDVPNAYIKDPLLIDSIVNLLDNYIYYRVEQDKYFIREATLDEVNAWYENIRPTEEQIPPRDLSQTSILPLDSIEFDMADAFGAKCSNVATMRTFGLPDGTIPDGFGIPFYFYDEFMKFNGFYDQVELMIADDDFVNDLQTRIDMLKDFRKDIKDADMPQWMLDELQAMHDAFPVGTAVRCRSSTNNEDLPGFSGAGLYTSKTQHLDEGHISKSIKQVYASMWNFRAFDERDFYRVDQYIAAMGILCHPNFEEEKSNGVGISIDPIFNTQNTFYLNTQVGESLITNPDPNSIPEEILLNQDPAEGYFVLRYSNLVAPDELVMEEVYLDQMRDYLQVIHDEFAILYDVVGVEGFGMDIEYKVTAQDQLIIKQARPWVSFWSEINSERDLAVVEITDPVTSSTLTDAELVTTKVENQGLKDMSDFELSLYVGGQLEETIMISDTLSPFSSAEYEFTVPQDFSMLGDYNIEVVLIDTTDGYSRNDTFATVISKIHFLEGGLITELEEVRCDNKVEVIAKVSNYGESTFSSTDIEVVVNSIAVDTVNYAFNIPYLLEIGIPITVTENLMPTGNDITLNLLSVNGAQDAITDNNSSSIMTDLDSDSDYLTLIINADNYPEETSWQLYDEVANILVGEGQLESDDVIFTENICVDYNSCFKLFVFDSYGDGICCGFGQGDFLVVNSLGETLLTNDGDFGSQAEVFFCPSDIDCTITADITTTNASDENVPDGIITIDPSNGIGAYEISIDGGITFTSNLVFENLPPGTYDIVVQGLSEICIYEETIEVEFDVVIDVDNISSNHIKLYPNPTNENFVIEIDEAVASGGNISMEIYNSLGELIQSNPTMNFENNSTSIISLGDYAAGTFIVKLYNNDFEKYFKVIKM